MHKPPTLLQEQIESSCCCFSIGYAMWATARVMGLKGLLGDELFVADLAD